MINRYGGVIIKKFGMIIVIVCFSLLVACSNNQSFEDFFQKKMEENKKDYDEDVNYSYSLIHHDLNVVHPDDAVAVFLENNLQGEQIFIAYFEKINGHWNWKQTRGSEWDTPQKWSFMNNVPYIYSGAISDETIKEVYAGKEQAKIVHVKGNKRFWYAISNNKDVTVKYVKKDGTEELIEEIDVAMLKDWKGNKNK